jgi:heme exporter protein A
VPFADDPLSFAAEGIACRRGGRLLFAELHFAIQAGDLLLVRGANGSGKSSLLRLLAALLPPAGGRLLWGGRPMEGDRAAHRARLHLLGTANALKPALTVRENLAATRGLLGGRGGIRNALDSLGLLPLHDLPARFLSTGQRRRAALARLLVAPRPLWLLDEPEAGLDRAGRETLHELARAQRSAGGLVIVATHLDEAWEPSHLLDLSVA